MNSTIIEHPKWAENYERARFCYLLRPKTGILIWQNDNLHTSTQLNHILIRKSILHTRKVVNKDFQLCFVVLYLKRLIQLCFKKT